MPEPMPPSPTPAADRRLGFGVIAGLPGDMLAELAHEVESLGYGAFWVNDSGRPDADGLAGLAAVAAVAPMLDLGVGVVPLDRRSADSIAAEVRSLGLPVDRLRLGVGSGGASTRPLGVVRDGVAGLRSLLPEARLFVSALGPQMSRLAGQIADGVLFNWAVPARLVTVSTLAAEGARAAGRPPIERWTYVRTAVGPDARARLADEASRYARSPAYGRAFAAMGVPFSGVGITADATGTAAGADGIAAQVDAYRTVVDGVVIRALPTSWTLDEALAIARAAAPVNRTSGQ